MSEFEEFTVNIIQEEYIILVDSLSTITEIIVINTTNFDNILSPADDTLQKALDTLDEHTHILDDRYYTETEVDTLLDDKVSDSDIGIANGVAGLDTAGKVPAIQLPSYVDDVVEYLTFGDFPQPGESGKIYIALDSLKTYRWGGTIYAEISESLALGETSTTAYRGDRGKTAYDHSQTQTGNPHELDAADVEAVPLVTMTDKAIPRANGTTGILESTPVIIDDNEDISGVRSITLNTEGTTKTEAGTIAFNPDDVSLDFHSGLGPIAQFPYEAWVRVYNDTGVEIANGKPVYPVGQFGGHPSVALAIANTHEKISRPIYMTTMAIPDGQYGIVTKWGIVRELDTTIYGLGTEIYLSPTVEGGLQTARPSFPDYPIRIGGVTKSGVADGEITVDIGGSVSDTFHNFFNGTFRESIDFLITSTGGVITGSLSPSNSHPDMTMIFSDGFTMLTTTPDATIILTAGSDTIPQENFVYIPKSTKVLTVSTSDWPVTEHIKVANVILKSASNTETYGALGNRNWNDHIESTTSFQGHLSHMTERMRHMASHWDSGVEGSVIIVGGSDPDDVFLAVTSGVAYQLHKQSFPALNMQTGDHALVVNNFTTPYVDIANLNTQTLDSTGATLSGRYFSVVLWGVQNKADEDSHLMINLPSGSYSSEVSAITDAAAYSDFTIPSKFTGIGFLIARFTFQLSPVASGTWTLKSTQDLRGYLPNTTAGGGGAGGGVSSFLGLLDTPNAFTGQANKIPRVNSGETDLEFVTRDVIAGTPASATATGNAGQVTWDADYIYVCIATDTWKRVAISTW